MKKTVALILISFVFLGCAPDYENHLVDSEQYDYSEYIIEDSIETDINFMPEEIYTTNQMQEPLLKLKLITSEVFPSISSEILTTEFIRGSELIIRLEEIIEPIISFTAIGPAITYIELPEDITEISFINGSTIDQYTIEINQQEISVRPIEENFTFSLYSKTFRIPENSFAYVCGTNTSNTYIYTDFLAILEQNPDFIEFQFVGQGRIPYPTAPNGHRVNHSSRYYEYSDFNEFENLANVLNDYSFQNIPVNSGASVSMYSWNNVKFHSWIEN